MPSPKRPLIDPKTRDWKMARGQRVPDPTHMSEVLVHISLHRGTAAAYPGFGSRYHELQKMTGEEAEVGDVGKRAEQMTDEALRPLTRNSRITNLTAESSRLSNPNALHLDVKWEDSKGRENDNRLGITIGATG